MSGSVVDSGDMPALIEAASSFGERVGPYQKVAVYTLRRQPAPDPGRRRSAATSAAACARWRRSRPRDPSTNLNGAVIEGVRAADAADGARAGAAALRDAGGLHRRHRPRPPRQPRRTSTQALDSAGLRDLRHRRRAGGRPQAAVAHRPLGHVRVAEPRPTCRRASTRSARASRRRRGASTCCRTARRRARASTRSRSRRTAAGTSGRLAYRFNANGFGPNCDPNTRPPFDMKHPRQPAPEASDERPPSGGRRRPRAADLEPEAVAPAARISAASAESRCRASDRGRAAETRSCRSRAGGAVRGGATPPADARCRARGRGRSSCARGCSSAG